MSQQRAMEGYQRRGVRNSRVVTGSTIAGCSSRPATLAGFAGLAGVGAIRAGMLLSRPAERDIFGSEAGESPGRCAPGPNKGCACTASCF
jgi:hypothetical protein